jgi:hypothetical protein
MKKLILILGCLLLLMSCSEKEDGLSYSTKIVKKSLCETYTICLDGSEYYVTECSAEYYNKYYSLAPRFVDGKFPAHCKDN